VLTATANPSVAGDPVSLTATVSGGAADGAVTFFDGATVLAMVPLSANAQATMTTSLLGVGSHAITAVYGGDPNHQGGRSAPLVQVVEAMPGAPTPIITAPSLVPDAVQPSSTVARLRSTTLKANAGKVSASISCAGGRAVGSARFSIRAGHRGTVKVHVSRHAQISLASPCGPHHGTARLAIRQSSGASTHTNRRVTITAVRCAMRSRT
jgi:hypothetical protein